MKIYLFLNQKAGISPLFVAAENGYEQIVQLLLEKGEPNVDLPDQVLLLFVSFSFSFFFFIFSFFYFFLNVKYGKTPLWIAAFKGHEQIVQLLLEKGNPNVDLPNQVILLIVSFFFFSVSHFFFCVKYGITPLYIAAFKGHEQIVQLLLEKGKSNVDFANKDGTTPLFCAAFKGHEQIVQILLEKGKPNVDLPDQVLLLFVFFFFFFSISFFDFLFM